MGIVRTFSLAAVSLGVAACGRIGFDTTANGTGSDSGGNADAAVACAAGQQLAIDQAGIQADVQWVDTLLAVTTPQGFAVVYYAPDGSLLGASYAGAPGAYAEVGADATIAAANQVTSAAGAVAVGSQLLVAAAATGGTNLYPVNASLALQGNMTPRPSELPATRPLAVSGDGATLGLLYLGAPVTLAPVVAVSEPLEALQVTTSGAKVGPSLTIAPASENPGSAAIAAGSAGYVAAWLDQSGSSAVLKAARFDSQFAAAMPEVVIGNSSSFRTTPSPVGVFQPDLAWASARDEYLIVWSEPAGTSSTVWGRLFGPALAPLSTPLMLGTGQLPKLASDGSSFWVVWNDPTTVSNLAAAHVSATGQVDAKAITGTGGTVVSYDVLPLGNGVTLVWYERFAAAAGCAVANPPQACYTPLWAVPLCL